MDNLIKKFNEELKYYFPESRLEAVLFEIPLSESKSIDIRGDLNVMEFYQLRQSTTSIGYNPVIPHGRG